MNIGYFALIYDVFALNTKFIAPALELILHYLMHCAALISDSIKMSNII